MKIKLSMVYLAISIVVIVSVGIWSSIIGSILAVPLVFTVLGILGIEIIVAVIMFENKMSFMDLSTIPDTAPEPVKDHTKDIVDYIIENLKQKVSFKTIIESLQKSGYNDMLIEQTITEMENKKMIKFNKTEPKEAEPKPLKKKAKQKVVKKK